MDAMTGVMERLESFDIDNYDGQNFPNDYQILKGSNQETKGKTWSNERLLSTYVTCSDGLIGRMDGSIPTRNQPVYRFNQETQALDVEKEDLPPPQSVIYLDKSARPVEWMVRELWPVLATPDEVGVPQKPESYFLNIDKKAWLRRMGLPPQHLDFPPRELVDLKKIPNLKDHLARIRALYVLGSIDEEGLDKVWDMPTRLDGQHVMIVDEIKTSGQSLSLAQQLLAMAVPEATFSGAYWSVPGISLLNKGALVDGEVQFQREWAPVWYKEDFESGRGISGRDPSWPEKQEAMGTNPSNITQIGRHILSTPHHDPETNERVADSAANQLRREFKMMAKDLKGRRIFYVPSPDRPSKINEDDAKLLERIRRITGMGFNDWMAERDRLLVQD